MLGTNRPRNGGGKEGKQIAKNLRDYDEMFTAFCAAGGEPAAMVPASGDNPTHAAR